MSPASVLVVEDEQITSLDIQQTLEELGYTVVAATDNGPEAIALAREHRPDVVLMDIMLKGAMDGTEAARHIGRGLGIPVVFLTAFSDEATIERAGESAPYGFLTKPYRKRELYAGIEVAIHKSRIERQLAEADAWFASTLRCVGDAVIATDVEGCVNFLNPVAERMTGWTLEEARGHPVEDIAQCLAPAVDEVVESPVRRALAADEVVGIEFGSRLRSRSGAVVPIDDSAAPIHDVSGRVLGSVMVFRDVAERLRLENELRASETRFRNLFDRAAIGMCLVTLDGHLLQVNGAFCRMLGYPGDVLLRKSHQDLSHADDQDRERAQLYALLVRAEVCVQFEKRYLRPPGQPPVSTLASVSLLVEQRQPVCYIYQVHDLSAQKEAQLRLERLAYTDALTGLSNRSHLRQEMTWQLADARRRKRRLAVVFLDLDRFKHVNDSLGHDVGDALLETVAKRLKRNLRETDCVARLGGDEFVLSLGDIDNPEQVAQVTDKLRRALLEPVTIDGHDVVVSPSMGVSLFPDDATEERELLRLADNALYAAKTAGRNRVCFYQPEMGRRAEERMDLEQALQLALPRGEMVLEYQPITRLSDGSITACEALVRWRRDAGVISPDRFIPLAEETGFIVPLGEWVLRTACTEAAGWPEDIVVHVNCSPRQFREDRFVEAVAETLAATGLAPGRLCLELTEDTMLEANAAQLERFRRLRAHGVTLSVDDYGKGYSSLGYLKAYAPQSLKLDASFVRDLPDDPTSVAIVTATIAMAHALGMEVVAEGVETDAQRARLHAEGCDAVQGFLLHRPMVPAALAALFAGATAATP